MVAPQPADFDPQLANLIRHKVRRLIGHFGFTASDAEDLEQELYMKTFQGLAMHDPARAPREACAAGNVDRGIATIIERRNAQKRNWRRQRQLEDAAESLPDPAEFKHKRDCILDVRHAVSRLPLDLRRWAVWFAEHTEAEIIRLSGRPRGKVRAMQAKLAEILGHLDNEKES